MAHEENAGNRDLIKSQLIELAICIGCEKESFGSVKLSYILHPIVIHFLNPQLDQLHSMYPTMCAKLPIIKSVCHLYLLNS